ncbi:MAG: hypothetical protein KC613_04725 [Myxococcales bacterium]|nr:hypothetical protein [Myxococcales bacterium]
MRKLLTTIGLALTTACVPAGGGGGDSSDAARPAPDLGGGLRLDAGPPMDAAPQADLGAVDAAVVDEGVPPDQAPRPACSDGEDNDGDGRTDFPDDPGCEASDDGDEADPPTECADGLDNDGDGRVDVYDSDCTGPADRVESGPDRETACSNGVDDDGDGLTDFPADPGCVAAGHSSEADPSPLPACANGADDDGDGATDYPADPGCAGAGDEDEVDPAMPPACANGLDDDDSGAADWPDDPGCDAAGDPTEVGPCGADVAVVDLNGWLAQNGAYEGDLTGRPDRRQGTCGGSAGGEVVFRYVVQEVLDRLVFSTRNPGTQAPVVMYLREACGGADLLCDRGPAEDPGVALAVEDPPVGAGYYLTVDTGSRMAVGPFRLEVDAVRPPACRNGVDDDGDGAVDLLDPGCEGPEDADEVDPADAPACANGLDDDGDGQTDYPADPDCLAAGHFEEAPPCALNSPVLRVGQRGGDFALQPLDGGGAAQGRCEPGVGAETVIVLTLTEPSDVTLQVLDAAGASVAVGLHARADCADPASEVGCRRAAASAQPLALAELDRGTWFLFAEQGIVRPQAPLTARVTVQSVIGECNDLVDNDQDGAVDLADPGCEHGRDDSERDPPEPPVCANGLDDDGDGLTDYPTDPDCVAAGAGDEARRGCANHPQWRPVECVTGAWVWSSDRQFQALEAANEAHTLWTGCNHAGDNPNGLCSLDGTGWVSSQSSVMAGCNNTWYHIGGRFSGNCGGHDGDTVRRLALREDDCYDY